MAVYLYKSKYRSHAGGGAIGNRQTVRPGDNLEYTMIFFIMDQIKTLSQIRLYGAMEWLYFFLSRHYAFKMGGKKVRLCPMATRRAHSVVFVLTTTLSNKQIQMM